MYAANPTPVATGASCLSSQAIHKVLIGSNSPVWQHQPRRKMYVSIPPNPHPTRLNNKSSDTIQPQAERNKRKASPAPSQGRAKRGKKSMAAPGLLAHRQAAELESHAQPAAAGVFLAKELESCEASAEKGHMICKVLDFLTFVCSFELKAIVCKEHSILLPLDGIKPHLRKHNWGFRDSRLPLDKVVKHIRNFHCHNISTSFDPPLFPLMLSAPFEINSDRRTIRFRYQCPQPQCNLWITRNDTYAG